MKKKIKPAKLNVKKEKIRNLSKKDLGKVDGGATVVQSQTLDTARCTGDYRVGWY